MSSVRFRISMSLDGYIAGPHQSVDHPLGIGGERLHQWAFATRAFREHLGLDGGEETESTIIAEEYFHGVGATVMGRNMFGGHPGGWDPHAPWTGWWGNDPPFHHPVYVITHHARQPLHCEGGTTFHFVTGGIHEALDAALRTAGTLDVSLGGGANTARQFLTNGLLDEMVISLVPTLLGAGERLFESTGDELHGLRLVRTITTPDVTHFTYRRA